MVAAVPMKTRLSHGDVAGQPGHHETPLRPRHPEILSRPGPRLRPALGVVLASFCGALLAAGSAPAAPQPLPPDPAIAALLAQVSIDSLTATVRTLQGFYNRNTTSDTSSAVVGIGAARNWLHRRFAQIGNAPGGRLQATYFDFDATICGLEGHHRNVLGTLRGGLSPDRIFLTGGHLDSRTTDLCDRTSFAPGANDDGSAIASLLEQARLLQTLTTDATVIFQGFTGEEQGTIGSEHFRDFAVRSGLRIQGVLNSDIIGNVNGCPDSPDCGGGPPTDVDSLSLRCYSGDPATGWSRQLARLAKLIGQAYVPQMTVHLIPLLDRQGRGGDQIPFYEAGFPAVRFVETLEYTLQQHSPQDVIDNMEFRYLQRNVKVNLALLADLAMAPPTPTGEGVFDLGTGGAIRAVWPAVPGIPDLAGYRVAYRFPSQGDSLYYADVRDAGPNLSLDINGLPNEVTVAVSVSAYDRDNHESVFSPEQLVTPGIVPHLPPGFTVASQADQIELRWNQPQELDLAGFRVYRSLDPNGGFVVIDSLDAGARGFTDHGVVRGTDYYYRLSSVDRDGNESPRTPPDKGRLVEHQHGVLLVDATLNGPGGLGTPTDAEVDSYYATLLFGVPVAAQWDWVVNYDQNGILLTDADMGRYQTVIIHSDVRQSSIGADTTEIRQYLEAGGQVWITGWNLKESLGGKSGEFGAFPPGSFFHDVVHADSIRTALSSESDFQGADPMANGYPSLTVDASKWPFQGGT